MEALAKTRKKSWFVKTWVELNNEFNRSHLQQGGREIPDLLRSPEAPSRLNLWSWSRMTLGVKSLSSTSSISLIKKLRSLSQTLDGVSNRPRASQVPHNVPDLWLFIFWDGPQVYRGLNKGTIPVETELSQRWVSASMARRGQWRSFGSPRGLKVDVGKKRQAFIKIQYTSAKMNCTIPLWATNMGSSSGL